MPNVDACESHCAVRLTVQDSWDVGNEQICRPTADVQLASDDGSKIAELAQYYLMDVANQ